MGKNRTIAASIVDLIGGTPAVRIRRLVGTHDAELYVKLEYLNPTRSSKDRAAQSMIAQAERDGKLQQGGTIIEITSGNTGIGLAAIAAAKGYKAIILMPNYVSRERSDLLKAYGAAVQLFDPEDGDDVARELAKSIQVRTPGSFIAWQSENEANPEVHRRSTALEILKQTSGRLDAFVCPSGTGGMITGAGETLREALPELQIYAVEPSASNLLSGGEAGRHSITGIGPRCIPPVLNRSIYDEVLQVSDADAWRTARELTAKEGIFGGPSTGAAVWASLEIARRLGPGKRVLTIAPDTGERYLSTGLYGESANEY